MSNTLPPCTERPEIGDWVITLRPLTHIEKGALCRVEGLPTDRRCVLIRRVDGSGLGATTVCDNLALVEKKGVRVLANAEAAGVHPAIAEACERVAANAPAKPDALSDVLAERVRQDAKFGEQNINPMRYLTVLTEEVGEIAKAILDIHFGKDTEAHLREEVVQAAAVALAFVECLDRGKWKAPAPTTTLTIRTAQEALRALIQRIEKSGLALTFNPDRGGSMYSDHDAPLNEEALARGELAVTLSPSRRSAASSESPVVGAPQP